MLAEGSWYSPGSPWHFGLVLATVALMFRDSQQQQSFSLKGFFCADGAEVGRGGRKRDPNSKFEPSRGSSCALSAVMGHIACSASWGGNGTCRGGEWLQFLWRSKNARQQTQCCTTAMAWMICAKSHNPPRLCHWGPFQKSGPYKSAPWLVAAN